jgi:arylformamidase
MPCNFGLTNRKETVEFHQDLDRWVRMLRSIQKIKGISKVSEPEIYDDENWDVFDISPAVNAQLGVFPGDTSFSLTNQLDFDKGHNLRLNTLTTTLHIGAHVDAPSHYLSSGRPMGDVLLTPYLGTALVITADVELGTRVGMHNIDCERINQKIPKRILLRTNSFKDPYRWNSDFCGIEPSLVHFFASKGVILIGIDTPSVDFEDSKDLPCHAAFAATGIAILEGIVLNDVEDGVYELIALPLNLQTADASPVRAVLRRRV